MASNNGVPDLKAISVSANVFLSFTWAERSIEIVESGLRESFNGAFFARAALRRGKFTVGDIYESEPPRGGAYLYKVLLNRAGMEGQNTLIRTNVRDGWNSLSNALAELHKGFQIQVLSTRSDDDYPKHRFEVWRGGVSVRIVMAMRDSNKWIFFQQGNPEPFESETLYDNKIIKTRLNRDILVLYLSAALSEFGGNAMEFSDAGGVLYEELTKK